MHKRSVGWMCGPCFTVDCWWRPSHRVICEQWPEKGGDKLQISREEQSRAQQVHRPQSESMTWVVCTGAVSCDRSRRCAWCSRWLLQAVLWQGWHRCSCAHFYTWGKEGPKRVTHWKSTLASWWEGRGYCYFWIPERCNTIFIFECARTQKITVRSSFMTDSSVELCKVPGCQSLHE